MKIHVSGFRGSTTPKTRRNKPESWPLSKGRQSLHIFLLLCKSCGGHPGSKSSNLNPVASGFAIAAWCGAGELGAIMASPTTPLHTARGGGGVVGEPVA